MSDEKTTPASVSNLTQNPPRASDGSEKSLEMAIGRELRAFRRRQEVTVAELANRTGLSIGMLSKIENGNTSPSLKTLQTLATALSLPITTFFRGFEARQRRSTQKAVKGSRSRRLAARRAIKHVFWDISTPHQAGSSQNHIWSRCAQRRIFSNLTTRRHRDNLHAGRRNGLSAWRHALPADRRRQLTI